MASDPIDRREVALQNGDLIFVSEDEENGKVISLHIQRAGSFIGGIPIPKGITLSRNNGLEGFLMEKFGSLTPPLTGFRTEHHGIVLYHVRKHTSNQ